MIDMGEFHPEAAVSPTRTPDGRTLLGRLTTTEEQRAEAIAAMTAHVAKNSNRGHEVKARIRWSHGDPTILEVSFTKEHIEGKPVFLPARITETELNGAVIPPSEEARLRILQDELAQIARSTPI